MSASGRENLGAWLAQEQLHWEWVTAVRHARKSMLRFGQEQQPQLLRVQSRMMAGSNGVDHSDSHLVYRAEQVVCRPVNHS